MQILRKEERPVAIVALIVFAALNALLIANHWQSFTRGAHVGFWSVFYNHLNMSGYDIFSLIFISCMRLHWNALRHPLFVALLLPLFWLNHQIMPPTEFNAAVLLMGALLDARIGLQGIDVGLQRLVAIDKRIVFDDQLVMIAHAAIVALRGGIQEHRGHDQARGHGGSDHEVARSHGAHKGVFGEACMTAVARGRGLVGLHTLGTALA